MFRRRPEIEGRPLGPGHRVLAAVSGGGDSVAMLRVLNRLKTRWGYELVAAYVHHGASSEPRIDRFRSRAEKKVAQIAKSLGLEFAALRSLAPVGPRYTDESANPFSHQSEDVLRSIRHSALSQFAKKTNVDVIVLGHHADDLFETRLIRMLRGTGPHGLTAMTELSLPNQAVTGVLTWRPLLAHARAEIEDYLLSQQLKKNRDWLTDPSNRDLRYLRNAIRHRLIPEIEKVRKGGVKSLARSLELIAEAVPEDRKPEEDFENALDRRSLLKLEAPERSRALAKWARAQGLRSLSKTHIEEVLKRIDTPQKRLTFMTGGCMWTVDETIRLKSDI